MRARAETWRYKRVRLVSFLLRRSVFSLRAPADFAAGFLDRLLREVGLADGRPVFLCQQRVPLHVLVAVFELFLALDRGIRVAAAARRRPALLVEADIQQLYLVQLDDARRFINRFFRRVRSLML